MRILIIDDSLTSRQLLIKCLNALEYKDIIETDDGVKGFEMLRQDPSIELILLDRYMPNMDGLEFLKKYHADESMKKVPVAMITSEAKVSEKMRAIVEYEPDYYITKPVSNGALITMLNQLFPDKAGQV